jgi:hypothetical protein
MADKPYEGLATTFDTAAVNMSRRVWGIRRSCSTHYPERLIDHAGA